jgi:Family of unknown function (DUF5819)
MDAREPEQSGISEDAAPAATGPGVPPQRSDGADGGEPLSPAPTFSVLSWIVIAFVTGVIAIAVVWHVGTVFLTIAPPNTISKKHHETIDAYVIPEFEQNWKLFAPNPLQQNIAVQTRAEVRTSDGSTRRTGWIDLTAQDIADIRHNPAPSHTRQNELRRAWEYWTNTHDQQNQPTGPRGELSDRYMRRIVMLRLGPDQDGGRVVRIQLRGAYTSVPAPSWSDERIDVKTSYRNVDWWTVNPDDLQKGDRKSWIRQEAGK